ncbi:MAG TPA: hypothetical protein VG297_20460 [Bryobacteraceae bacterium]|jgi:hypothetical protein|nr:hypothetical protein [Bryobacteraceae bacterium]
MHRACLTIALLAMPLALAQSPTTRDLMLDLIHPASNDLLLALNRNGPSTSQEWSDARRNSLTLTESGTLLAPLVNSDAWRAATKLLSDAGAEAYKAAQSKDAKALAIATAHIDAACTACHKQFRPNVFPLKRQEPGA